MSVFDQVFVVGNRFWGHKDTSNAPGRVCTALSSRGESIVIHKTESDFVRIESNIIYDSANGILVQGLADNIEIMGNLISNVANGAGARGAMELTAHGVTTVRLNTIVNAGTYFSAGGFDTEVTQNLFVDSGDWSTTNGLDFSADSRVGFNTYSNTQTVYAGSADAGSNDVNGPAQLLDQYCFQQRKLTAPVTVCLDKATSSLSTRVPKSPAQFVVQKN